MILRDLMTSKCKDCDYQFSASSRKFYCCDKKAAVCIMCRRKHCSKCKSIQNNQITVARCKKCFTHSNKNGDDTDMFYQHLCDCYYCAKCLIKAQVSRNQMVLPCGHKISQQQWRSFLQNFCFKCGEQFDPMIDRELLDYRKICSKCYKIHYRQVAKDIIKCMICDEVIRHSKEAGKANQQFLICKSCFRQSAIEQRNLQIEKDNAKVKHSEKQIFSAEKGNKKQTKQQYSKNLSKEIKELQKESEESKKYTTTELNKYPIVNKKPALNDHDPDMPIIIEQQIPPRINNKTLQKKQREQEDKQKSQTQLAKQAPTQFHEAQSKQNKMPQGMDVQKPLKQSKGQDLPFTKQSTEKMIQKMQAQESHKQRQIEEPPSTRKKTVLKNLKYSETEEILQGGGRIKMKKYYSEETYLQDLKIQVIIDNEQDFIECSSCGYEVSKYVTFKSEAMDGSYLCRLCYLTKSSSPTYLGFSNRTEMNLEASRGRPVSTAKKVFDEPKRDSGTLFGTGTGADRTWLNQNWTDKKTIHDKLNKKETSIFSELLKDRNDNMKTTTVVPEKRSYVSPGFDIDNRGSRWEKKCQKCGIKSQFFYRNLQKEQLCQSCYMKKPAREAMR